MAPSVGLVERSITRSSSRYDMGFAVLNPLSYRLLGLRKQLGAPAGEPVHQQPDPFVPGRIGTLEAIAQSPERTAQILRTAGAPIDRVGLDRKAGAAECADRARHVMCGGHEQPALARFRVGDGLAGFRVLLRVPRL